MNWTWKNTGITMLVIVGSLVVYGFVSGWIGKMMTPASETETAPGVQTKG